MDARLDKRDKAFALNGIEKLHPMSRYCTLTIAKMNDFARFHKPIEENLGPGLPAEMKSIDSRGFQIFDFIFMLHRSHSIFRRLFHMN